MARIVFVQNLWFEFMGPMYLSAALKNAGHECRLVITETGRDLPPNIITEQADIFAFSVMTGMQNWALDMSRWLKSRFPDCLVIFGGPHATFFPDIINRDGVDIICRGEGEEALVELADAVASRLDYSRIANLWVKQTDGSICRNDVRSLNPQLDSLPLPDRSLYAPYQELWHNPVQTFISSRGCPYNCTFCFNHQMVELYRGKGRYVRHRSPGQVIAEIEQLRQVKKIKRVYFADDTFALDKAWLQEFLPVYGTRIGLPFHCLIRINQLDAGLVHLMKANGCETVFFGIESGDETIRNQILNKDISDHEIIRGASLLKQAGIRFRTYNIVGFPGETFEQALKTVQINIAIGTDYPWCSIFTPYPGTKLAHYACEQGYLPSTLTADAIDSSFFVTSMLQNPDSSRLVNLQKFFQTVVLLPATLPLFKLLTRLPENILFRIWFALVYFIVYVKSEGRGISNSLKAALRNLHFIRLR